MKRWKGKLKLWRNINSFEKRVIGSNDATGHKVQNFDRMKQTNIRKNGTHTNIHMFTRSHSLTLRHTHTHTDTHTQIHTHTYTGL